MGLGWPGGQRWEENSDAKAAGWGLSPLQSACDFWEPVRALTTPGLAPPESAFLEVTARGGRGCAGGQAEAQFPQGGALVGLGWLLP